MSAPSGRPEVGLQLDLADQPRLVVVADLDPAPGGAGGDAPRAGRAVGLWGWLPRLFLRRLLGLKRRCLVLLLGLAEQGSQQISGCGWHGCGVTASSCQCCQWTSAGTMARGRSTTRRQPDGQQQTAAPGAPLRQGIKHHQQEEGGLRPRPCIRVSAADDRAAQPRGPGPGGALAGGKRPAHAAGSGADSRRPETAAQRHPDGRGGDEGAASGSAAERGQGLMQEAVRVPAPRCRPLSDGPLVGAVLARLHGTAGERQKWPSA